LRKIGAVGTIRNVSGLLYRGVGAIAVSFDDQPTSSRMLMRSTAGPTFTPG